MKSGAPPTGTPGGHIGKTVFYAYCTVCRLEWVWNACGCPPCMESCTHPDNKVVVVKFRAEFHGTLEETMVNR